MTVLLLPGHWMQVCMQARHEHGKDETLHRKIETGRLRCKCESTQYCQTLIESVSHAHETFNPVKAMMYAFHLHSSLKHACAMHAMRLNVPLMVHEATNPASGALGMLESAGEDRQGLAAAPARVFTVHQTFCFLQRTPPRHQ